VHGDLLDVVLLVLCVAAAFSGFRQGLVYGVLWFAGLLGGGYLGVRLTPVAVRHLHSISAPVVGVVCVVGLAVIGTVIATAVGLRIRTRLTWRPIRAVDSVGGGALLVVAVLVVGWSFGTVITSTASRTGLATQVRRSEVIAAVDGGIPPFARTDLAQFRRFVDDSGFPAIVGPLSTESVAPVSPPDPAVVDSAAVRADQDSIVKIRGDAPSCDRTFEGSGFVIAPDRVLTNAHVVGGVAAPRVYPLGGGSLAATVVLFDPDTDVAVLEVPGLHARALRFAGVASAGTSGVVAGYPEDGPFRPVAARVRDRQPLTGPNIYQTRTVTRDVYAIRAQVLPGNSGGPLLATDGTVYGVVFAAATSMADTGFALTAAQIAPDVRSGESAQGAVSTQGCE
jgi:S1-C subfamily serine protease